MERRVPKERYWPLEGWGGGTRLRSEGGRERRFGRWVDVGGLLGDVEFVDLRCSLWLSRF